SWAEVSDDFAAAWRSKVGGGAAPAVRFVVVPVGSHLAENVAIESVTLPSPPAVKDQPTEVEVSVRNHGRSPRSAVPLVLTGGRGDEPLLRTTVDLAPRSVQSVRASVRFGQTGPQVLTATIDAPGAAFDDTQEM